MNSEENKNEANMSEESTETMEQQANENAEQSDDQPMPTVQELAELRQKAAERDEFLDLVRRTQAEFQNYQKRQQKDREQEREYMRGGMVKELLPVLDNLERALGAAAKEDSDNPLLKGVSMVQSQFLDLLKSRFDVTPIDATGQKFNPNLHEAITQVPSPQHDPDTIIQVVETGYKMNERVLRPAKVVVCSEKLQQ